MSDRDTVIRIGAAAAAAAQQSEAIQKKPVGVSPGAQVSAAAPADSVSAGVAIPGENDPVVRGLIAAAALYNLQVGAPTILAGAGIRLPVGLADLPLLAERAGLTSEPVEKSLAELAYIGTPALLVGKDGTLQLAARWLDADRVVLTPLSGAKDTLVARLAELEANYGRRAVLLRPAFHFDRRTGGVIEDENQRDWFWGTILQFRRYFADVAIAALLINAFGLVTAMFAMQVYDRVVPNNALDTLWVLALGALIVASFDLAMRTLRGRYIDMAGAKADLIMARKLFERLLGMRLSNRPASAGALAMTMREFETVREFFTSATMTALIDLPFVLIFIGVIGMLGGWIAFVPALAVPAIIGVGMHFQRRLGAAAQKSLRQKAHRGSLLVESMTGLEIIKSRTAEGQMLRSWQDVNEASAASSNDIRRYSAAAVNFATFAYTAVYVLMIIWGVYEIAAGNITMGALIACSILLGRTMAPLASVAGLLVRLAQSREALSRLNLLMQTPIERPAGRVFSRPAQMRCDLEIRDADFAYGVQTRNVIDKFSLKIKRGEKVGVIGPIGCGKSTLARLIVGLYEPTSGSIMCDGLDIRQIDPSYFRTKIGYVEQSPFLFFGTIRENISLGHPDIDPQAVMRAAKTAGVLDFVGDSAQGLEFMLAERGENLSGGQRQAICLARAMLLDPAILVLDEPTSAMDPMSEERFKQRLSGITKDRTVIVFTHKASLLSLVDRLVVLDHGRIMAEGPREAVLKALQEGRVPAVRGNAAE